jgi:effector-binding domain-containing protein
MPVDRAGGGLHPARGASGIHPHGGPYSGLGAAHRAVLDWCASQGLQPVGTRWEVYGPHRDDPAEMETQVYWLLS